MSKEYFAHPGISASLLKKYAGEEFSPLQASQPFGKQTDNMRLGSAVHSGLQFLGPISPKEFVESRYDSFRTKDAKLWKDEMKAAGIDVLSNADWAKANAMIKKVLTDPVIGHQVKSDDADREIELYGNGFKAMMDLVVGDTVYDYKTCSDPRPSQICKDAYHYKYHLQAYHYLMVAQEQIGPHVKNFVFIFISSSEPHDVVVMRPTKLFMELGRKQWVQAYTRLEKWKGVANPPGYALGEPVELDVPAWAKRELKDSITDDFQEEL